MTYIMIYIYLSLFDTICNLVFYLSKTSKIKKLRSINPL